LQIVLWLLRINSKKRIFLYPTACGGVVLALTRYSWLLDSITLRLHDDEGRGCQVILIYPLFMSLLCFLICFAVSWLIYRPVGRVEYKCSRKPQKVEYKSSSTFIASQKALSSTELLKPQLYHSPNPYLDRLEQGWHVLVPESEKEGG